MLIENSSHIEKNIVVLTNYEHNHHEIPPNWRITDQTKKEIRGYIINDPKTSASSYDIQKLQSSMMN